MLAGLASVGTWEMRTITTKAECEP
jgi:hypothetical protein